MSQAPIITLAGHVLNERFSITDLSRPLPPSRNEWQTIPGAHGDTFRARTMGPRKLSFTLWTHISQDSHADLQAEAALLASWLWPSSPGLLVLTISDEDGRVRLVVPDGDLNFDEYERRGAIRLSFVQPDPICDLGSAKTYTVPSGGSVTLVTGGTHPAKIAVAATSAVRNSTSLLWSLTFDSQDKLRIATGSSSGRAISIDCATRAVKLAGATHMVTLDSDWPELWPGTHTVTMDQGTGTATLTVQDRSI